MHPDRVTLMRWRERSLSSAEAEAIGAHVKTCEECAKAMQTMDRFKKRLDDAWTEKRSRETAARTHWPSREDLVDYYLDDLPSAESRQRIEAHLRECVPCQEILQELEQGAAELQKADPLREYAAETALSRGDWKEALRALLRPAAWPAWTMATVAAMAIFAVGMLLRPVVWPGGVIAPTELTAQMPKPALERHADGTLTLGIGATGAKPEAVALFREAMRFYDQPDFAERAVPFLERAVAADAQYEQPRFWLGICLLTQGRTSAAIPQLEEAARLAPGNVTYQHHLVWGYLKAGEYTKALAAQTRLLKGAR